ncbi:ACP S-malonyltransferase [Cellulomonas shaoxiangyii]|uniref:Malonyl CoA-acyl carrier protein transacylase n=1 Tax=Cellulomonas shaoxiangyii TaxID=2566013 RepID=A0A4P7SLB5_9CELL|nr:ACP S-malonyltransferase [Cellulomonas shaoxiangyii]QCB95012.1 ACP S-malonyltransferase [Cellulomonas shaoxiangyii]TGY86341.1 ACP S-malonyltransferase [Cellulomonas shaoxiangyii]
MRALVFAGQGIQRKGMGAGLFERYDALVAEADSVLGWSLRELCETGDTGRLTDTRYAQPAIFMVNALHALARADEGGGDYPVYAGHSLGELNALVAAGMLDLVTGLRLVRERGLAMAAVTGGGMVAVTGLGADRVEQVVRGSGLTQVFLANRNSDQQVTLGGESTQLGLASRLLRSAGARQVLPLRVGGAFHTPLMAPAQARFARALEGVTFTRGHGVVVSGVTGAEVDPDSAPALLTRQIVAPVQWVEVVRRMRRLGVTEVDELGSTTLTTMMRAVR